MHRIVVLNFLFSYHKVTNEALTLNKDFEMNDSVPDDESSDALYYSAGSCFLVTYIF